MEGYEGRLSFSEAMVRARLSDIRFPHDRIRIVPGFIEKTLNGPDLPKTVCFAYVDLNLYEPTLTALNLLDRVLQPCGSIVIDDYENFSTGIKSVVDEFCNAREQKYSVKLPVSPAEKFCILTRKA